MVSSASSFIHKADSVGSGDGLYLVGDEVFLVVNGQQVQLSSGEGTSYVSFMVAQDTSSGEKEQALKNIGFLYSSLEDIPATSV